MQYDYNNRKSNQCHLNSGLEAIAVPRPHDSEKPHLREKEMADVGLFGYVPNRI